MNDGDFILNYVQDCISARLSFADCGPLWQLGIIAILVAVAFLFVIAHITPHSGQSTKSQSQST